MRYVIGVMGDLAWLHFAGAIVSTGGQLRVDWNAVSAIASAGVAAIGLLAIWYSLVALKRQLRYQSSLQAKQLEQKLLLRVMDLAQLPYDAAHDFIADLLLWRLSGRQREPEAVALAARKVLDAHREFGTATASTLSVLRRSRRQRFPSGTQDHALKGYDDLVQRVLIANAKVIKHCGGDWSKLDLTGFQQDVGSDAFDIATLLRRVTAELLARMYADAPEWLPLEFKKVAEDEATGRVGYDFTDS